MKILHTADWHIGQLFHEYDRSFEHQQFLNWLVATLVGEQVDVLLVSGDVFDLCNPSAFSVKMFYTFLNNAIKANPNLQIIITAGNHDSASRLESPKPLLESSNIHIIGVVQRGEDGSIDFEKLIIPLKDKAGVIKAWCMAIPFLRMGDYPIIADAANAYAAGVTALYDQAYQYASAKKQPNIPVICMGHLHAQQAEITDMGKAERLIMGGVECISASAFHADIQYVALGHIHKAQRLGGKEHIRYCGSPIPMSFSELHYKHQVVVFNIAGEKIDNLKSIDIPLSVTLQRIPSVHSSLTEVLNVLQQLPAYKSNPEFAPYLEVRVLLDGPEPALRHKIETVLIGKYVRLSKIDVRYPAGANAYKNAELIIKDKLQELQPQDVFAKVYQSKYNNSVPTEILKLFNQVSQEVAQSETV